MQRSDFHYELPDALIAQYPLPRRGDSRLLELDGRSGELRDRGFDELPELLNPGDLLVFNDTKVMPARLYGHKAATGGRVEVLIERLLDPHRALAHIRASKPPRPGSVIAIERGGTLQVVARRYTLFELLSIDDNLMSMMHRSGHIPLPPYISRADSELDLDRYQTVYAERPGAVAAPTAGLHFDREMLDRLAAMGIATTRVTLHVGAGTFQPVRVERLEEHVMHSEYLEVSDEACDRVRQTQSIGRRVVAVGTTSVRSLESAAASGKLRPFTGDTRLFIRPGYRFNCVDAMITNFHLPESTLLMLVSAFAGHQQVMNAYRHAVREHYRFFSYGDAMFVTRRC